MVAAKLRQFRSAMTPTAAESDGERISGSVEVLENILTELQAIREKLEKE